MIKNNKDKDDYKVLFSGARISKKEANKAYIAVLFAVIGALIIHFIFGIENKTVAFLICLALSFFSYFVIVPKIIKK